MRRNGCCRNGGIAFSLQIVQQTTQSSGSWLFFSTRTRTHNNNININTKHARTRSQQLSQGLYTFRRLSTCDNGFGAMLKGGVDIIYWEDNSALCSCGYLYTRPNFDMVIFNILPISVTQYPISGIQHPAPNVLAH